MNRDRTRAPSRAARVALEARSSSISRWRWSYTGRLLLTAAILVAVLSQIDLRAMTVAMKQSLGPILAAAVLCNSLALVISAVKWDWLLQALRVRARVWDLLKLYTIGFFVNAFLPSVVGGDLLRWRMAGRHTGHYVETAASIVAERVTGLVALLLLSLPAAAFVLPRASAPAVASAVAILTAAVATLLVLTTSRGLTYGVLKLTRKSRLSRRAGRSAHRLFRTLRRFPRRSLLVALGWSVLFYLSAGLTFFLVCRAFGTPLTYAEATSVQVLIMLLIILPISVGGLGLAQAGDVYLLGLLGIGAPVAVGISLVRMLVAYAYAPVGAVFFARWPEAAER